VLLLQPAIVLAATNSGPVCLVINPIVEQLQGPSPFPICSCEDSDSGLGGTAECTVSVPTDQSVVIVPAVEKSGCIAATTLTPETCDVNAAPAVVLPPISFRIGTEVLPCGNPASAGVHGAVTIPGTAINVSALLPIINEAISQAGSPTMDGVSVSQDKSNNLMITIEKVASAAQGVRVDLPVFIYSGFQMSFRLTVTVGGDADSLSMNTAIDLCATSTIPGSPELWPSAVQLGNVGLVALLGNPPYEMFQLSATSFTSACSAGSPRRSSEIERSPSPPPPPPLSSPPPQPHLRRQRWQPSGGGEDGRLRHRHDRILLEHNRSSGRSTWLGAALVAARRSQSRNRVEALEQLLSALSRTADDLGQPRA